VASWTGSVPASSQEAAVGETHTEAVDGFDAATAVTALGGATYRAELSEEYAVLGNPNGGYLLAVLARAATAQLVAAGTNHPHCLAASVSFVRPPRCGTAELHVTVHRAGTRISHVRASLVQDDRLAADAELACGRLDRERRVVYERPCPVVLPDVEACERRPAGGLDGVSVEIMNRVDLRLDPATTGFVRGDLAEEAEVRGWLRLADGRPMDPLALLFAADVLPPATFPIGSTGWVPTVQLSTYVRAIPADGWLVARQLARSVADGLVDEVCELWDANGTVVAQATQLAMVRFPSGGSA
jgi:acyl-CoA thioesterase